MSLTALKIQQEQTLDSFFNCHFNVSSYNGFVQVWSRSNATGRFMPCAFKPCSDDENRVNSSILTPWSGYDYYITPNQFTGIKDRTNKHLFAIQNVVIDIDNHSGSIDASQFDSFYSDLYNYFIANGSMPNPQTIVYSGRGMQIWFAFDAVASSLYWLVDKLTDSLLKQFDDFLSEYSIKYEGLEVDFKASKAHSGLKRFPGTVNQKTGRIGTFERIHDERYNLTNLIKDYYPQTLDTKVRKSNSKHNTYKKDLSVLKSRIECLENYVEKGFCVKGKREMFFYVYCCNVMNVYDSIEARSRVESLNKKLANPFTIKELNTVVMDSKAKPYKFRSSTIAGPNWLNFSKEEIDAINWSNSSKPRNYTRDKKIAENKKIKAENKAKVLELHSQGYNISEIARLTNIPRKTVERYSLKKETV